MAHEMVLRPIPAVGAAFGSSQNGHGFGSSPWLRRGGKQTDNLGAANRGNGLSKDARVQAELVGPLYAVL